MSNSYFHHMTSRTMLAIGVSCIVLSVVLIGGYMVNRVNQQIPKIDQAYVEQFKNVVINAVMSQGATAWQGPEMTVTPEMILRAVPTIQPYDFDGVQSRSGKYVYLRDSLRWEAADGSTDRGNEALEGIGYAQLLENIGKRLNVAITSYGAMDQVMQLLQLQGFPEKQPPVPVDGSQPISSVSIANDFGAKVVYDATGKTDESLLQQDCSGRGGVYNACGNSCAPNAEVCATVCAAVCEKIPVPAPVACDANIPCPKGQSCYVLPGSRAPQCITGDPCQIACGSSKCLVLESYPAQVKCQ